MTAGVRLGVEESNIELYRKVVAGQWFWEMTSLLWCLDRHQHAGRAFHGPSGPLRSGKGEIRGGVWEDHREEEGSRACTCLQGRTGFNDHQVPLKLQNLS